MTECFRPNAPQQTVKVVTIILEKMHRLQNVYETLRRLVPEVQQLLEVPPTAALPSSSAALASERDEELEARPDEELEASLDDELEAKLDCVRGVIPILAHVIQANDVLGSLPLGINNEERQAKEGLKEESQEALVRYLVAWSKVVDWANLYEVGGEMAHIFAQGTVSET